MVLVKSYIHEQKEYEKMGNKSLLQAIAAIAFALTSTTHANPPTATPLPEITISEERNEAAGFAATMQMAMVVSLIDECRTMNGVADQADQAYQAWNRRNADATLAAWSYIALSRNAIANQHGEAAADEFDHNRKGEFKKYTEEFLMGIFKDKVVDVASCQKLVAAVEDRAMDISTMPALYKTLQEMGAALKKNQGN